MINQVYLFQPPSVDLALSGITIRLGLLICSNDSSVIGSTLAKKAGSTVSSSCSS